MCHELMAMPETIPLLPVPPKRRLSFPLLILKTISNPIASWSQDFYDEPVVFYRSLGIETLYVMDPALIQTILLDDSDSFSKNPPHEEILGGLGGKGLLDLENVIADTSAPGGAICRVGRHRSWGKSNTKLAEPYWAEPHTVPSPSGTRAVFASDWGNGATVDSYVLELPSYTP